VAKLSKEIKVEGKWGIKEDANKMWEAMADCIRRSIKEVLGVSRGETGRMKGAWWWSKGGRESISRMPEIQGFSR